MSWYPYVVGANQISGKGDQKKHFVSKSTLMYSTINCDVKFNSLHNVTVTLLAATWYEFKSNIHTVYVYDDGSDTTEGWLKMYFEGVMYDQARRPE